MLVTSTVLATVVLDVLSFNADRCSALPEFTVTATREEVSCSSFVIKKISIELTYGFSTVVSV